MLVAYVAGPYRAPTVYETRQNIRRAEDVAVELWRLGYCVLTPHLNSVLLDGIVPDSRFLAAGVEFVKRSDVVVMLPGWRQSAGSCEEYSVAKARGTEVYEWPRDRSVLEGRVS